MRIFQMIIEFQGRTRRPCESCDFTWLNCLGKYGKEIGEKSGNLSTYCQIYWQCIRIWIRCILIINLVLKAKHFLYFNSLSHHLFIKKLKERSFPVEFLWFLYSVQHICRKSSVKREGVSLPSKNDAAAFFVGWDEFLYKKNPIWGCLFILTFGDFSAQMLLTNMLGKKIASNFSFSILLFHITHNYLATHHTSI